MKEIILVGGGGHCNSCIDVIEETGLYKIAGILDLPEKLNSKIFGYKVIATDDDLPQLANQYDTFFITLGQIKTPAKRIEIFNKLKELNLNLPTIVSPCAHVSRHSEIGEGSIVMHYALVNPGAKVGNNCIVNSKALIEHDATIGQHCHISTGAIINGGVCIGEGSFVGSNSVIREGVNVAKNSVIGFGCAIAKDLT